jgi:hypothetical protein
VHGTVLDSSRVGYRATVEAVRLGYHGPSAAPAARSRRRMAAMAPFASRRPIPLPVHRFSLQRGNSAPLARLRNRSTLRREARKRGASSAQERHQDDQ